MELARTSTFMESSSGGVFCLRSLQYWLRKLEATTIGHLASLMTLPHFADHKVGGK